MIGLLREMQGMLVVARQYGSSTHKRLEADIAKVRALTRRELTAGLDRLSENVAEARKTLRPRLKQGEFAALLTDARKQPADYVFITKAQLFAFWRESAKLYPYLVPLPWHTRISLDIHGIDEEGFKGEWRLLEAGLYEDMCAHFNRAWHLTPIVAKPKATRVQYKESAASRRGAVSSAFYLVEAYLNSLAFDHVVTSGKGLPQSTLDLLTEWDSSKGRRKHVSFRDKLLHYPRVILGRTHPIFQENNSTAIAFLLTEAKDFRDAIVHANPRPVGGEIYLEKESRFWQVGVAHADVYRKRGSEATVTADHLAWAQVVDTSIEVLFELEKAISGNLERLYWLHRRANDGLFDNKVFE